MKKTLTSLAKRLARPLMRNDAAWKAAQLLPNDEFFRHVRRSVIRKKARNKVLPLLEDRTVRQGPFAGLQYAETASVGSMIWPKLLGTYESELQPFLNEISHHDYRKVIDIGYAEGFYLIGLGRWFDQAELVGFDLEPEAERLCRGNADANDIRPSRLKLYGGFDSKHFNANLTDDSLVVIDCEGFEDQVIQGISPEQAACADWLIETHDHLVPGTTERIVAKLRSTHDVKLIDTDEDFQPKCRLLPESIHQQCDQEEKEAIVTEGRVEPQSWVVATRRAA
ncbi:MAG: hypothetical protein AAF989_04490 [Planctomycetota bacterium]